MSLAPGMRIGPHEILAQIGVGGMGEVDRATDTNLGRQVAIKVLPDTTRQRTGPFRQHLDDMTSEAVVLPSHPRSIIDGGDPVRELDG